MRTFVQRIAVSQLTFKGFLGHPVTRGIKAAQRLFKRVCLLCRRKELDLYNPLHRGKYDHETMAVKPYRPSLREPEGPIVQAHGDFG